MFLANFYEIVIYSDSHRTQQVERMTSSGTPGKPGVVLVTIICPTNVAMKAIAHARCRTGIGLSVTNPGDSRPHELSLPEIGPFDVILANCIMGRFIPGWIIIVKPRTVEVWKGEVAGL